MSDNVWGDTARIVDVSHWQPEEDATHHRLLDWKTAVRDGNLVAAIIKYSQGINYNDPAAYLHAYNAWQAGVPLLSGYHFGDGSDGAHQAMRFLDIMHDDWGADLSRVMLMLDAEENKRSQMSVRQAELFVLTIKDGIGRWPWLYTGRDGPEGPVHTGKGLPSAILSNCQLILPKYGPPPTAANLPEGWRFPRGGTDRGEPGMGVLRAVQFTDGKTNGGPIAGLGRVDQSRFIGFASIEEAAAVWAG